MIRELHVTDLALIHDLALEPGNGFCVFTGETGAGKSILVGAIGLLLGERADGEHIRAGSQEATVSGVFQLPSLKPSLATLLETEGIPCDDNTLIFRRCIQRNGKNRAWVNQTPVTIASLKRIGDLLVDIHGQHDHQSLLHVESARITLDGLPGVSAVAARYAAAYTEYTARQRELDEHDRRARDLAERRDVIVFQHKEIAGLQLSPGDEVKLEAELSLLSSSTQRAEAAAAVHQALGGDEPVVARLTAARRGVQLLAKYDPSVASWLIDLESVTTTLDVLTSFAAGYADRAIGHADPARLEHINDRLARIQRLKKKYRCSAEDLIARQEQLKVDLGSMENLDVDRSTILRRVDAATDACIKAGRSLSKARREHAAAFDRRVAAQMRSLGFTTDGWRTEFASEPEPRPHGLETCQYLVRANAGEPFLPLAKTASGGEVSRLMLAVKTVLAEQDNIPVLIFDEIDTGIGGTVANEVARCLRSLSRTHQVLCISHLHQIASLAEQHFQVYKEMEDGRTVTRVKLLSREEQVGEIARMLGSGSENARRLGRELITGA
jgi:DNA repair protein RecN (Recombination protein N)